MEKGKLEVTLYIRPHGRKQLMTIGDIYKDDAEWLQANNIKVGMEDCGLIGFALYFNTGREVDGEPEELTILAGDRTCRDTIKEGVEKCKQLLKHENRPHNNTVQN